MDAERTLGEAARELEKAERLLTVAIAAQRLSVCGETIRRWIRAGRLEARRLPSGHYKVPERVIENILTTPHHTARHL
ncbi:MAG: helix-turn-helix domain-containing protein [Vicinamibacterales bacterium]